MKKKSALRLFFINSLIYLLLFLGQSLATSPNWLRQYLQTLFTCLFIYTPTPLRKIILKNLAYCFPDWDKTQYQTVMKENIQHLVTVLFDLLPMIWPNPRANLPKIVNMEGLDAINQALSEKKGVLLLFPHFISIYLVGYLLIKAKAFPFSLMYNPPKNPLLKRFFAEKIGQYCNPIFTRKQTRALIQALKKGKIVLYAPDLEPPRKHAVFAPFFGHLAATYQTTARIAELSGAQIFFIDFCRNESERTYQIRFSQPLVNYPSGDKEKDATQINQVIEKSIKEKPSQYLWLYKRFTLSAEGGKTDLYS